MYIKNIIIGIFLLISTISASNININETSIRTTYEDVTLYPNENMGMIGINYLRENANWNYGIGIYGALKGKRGGYFSGGIALGYKYPLVKNLSLDTGLFLGGGTGDGKDKFGNGVMIRSHAGLLYNFKDYELGASFTNVTYPQSKTDSNHISFVYNVPFKTVSAVTTNSGLVYEDLLKSNKQFGWRKQYMALTYQLYSPKGNTRKKGNGPLLERNISLLGFEYGYYYNKNLFSFFETSEAINGDIAGYAEVIAGLGYDLPVSSNFDLKLKGAFGSGGGSGVDVAGGILLKANTGLYYKTANKSLIGMELGYIDAPEGNFTATNTKFMYVYNFNSLTIGNNVLPIETFKSNSVNLWRMRVGLERYMASTNIRKNKEDKAADLMTFKFDRFIDKNWYLSGQGFGAFSGGISGYGGGLLGFGYQTNTFLDDFSLYAELLAGPGGAGGVSSGDGFLAHPMIGVNYKLNNSIDLQLGVGHVKSISGGTLDTTAIDVTVVYKFRTIEQ